MAQHHYSETAEVFELNDRSGKAIAGLIFLLMLAGGSSVASVDGTSNPDESGSPSGDGQGDQGPGPDEEPSPECMDGIDNDGDGLIDEEDPDCDPQNPNFDETEG